MSCRAEDIGAPAGMRHIAMQRLGAGSGPLTRAVAEEVPVEITYQGQSYAVMMATPCDLEDFVVGFTLSERLVSSVKEIASVRLTDTGEGWLAECMLAGHARRHHAARRRQRVAESSCGLCGVRRLAQVHEPLPRVRARLAISEEALFRSLDALYERQPLNQVSGGVHAAALVAPDGRLLLVREDVGRHNAFDKLIGAAARQGVELSRGYALLSSRCSYELVEKAIVAGLPMLVTISAPTSLAVERAVEHDLTLVALARHDSVLAVHDPHGAIRPAV